LKEGNNMADYIFIRNNAYMGCSFGTVECHSERKKETYYNCNIVSDRTDLNVHFKSPEGTYEGRFNDLLADGTVVERGLRKDAKLFDEFVIDINSAYFDAKGGYEYAKAFYEEAYRFAVKEISGEEYVLPAVMYADELNKALSDQAGRDVWHYDLHVIYVPVVRKDIVWTKKCRDKSLVGTVKESIMQISNNKKWPIKTPLVQDGEAVLGSDGQPVLVNAYSMLQDRVFGHMREAGYHDVERGNSMSEA
jgi:hypothetical protein